MKSKRLLSITLLVVVFSCFYSQNAFAQQAGESDRMDDGSFSVPGWFSKDKSDIARYPVPLTPSTAGSQSSQGPVVVFDKFGGITNKTIYTPTPFGLQPRQDFSAMASNPWAAPGAAPFAYGYPGIGGFGGYRGYNGGFSGGFGGLAGLGLSAVPGWGGIPGIGSIGIPSIPGIPGIGIGIPGLGAGRSFSGFYGGYGNPYIRSSGFSGFGLNRVSRTIMAQPDPKPAGGYYTPPKGNTGSGYYSSGTPVIPMPQAVMPKQPPRDYWGDNGNPFGKDMNKTPW